MNRRTAIRNAVMITAGVAFLPSCVAPAPPSFVAKNFSLSQPEIDLLAKLADIFIPKTSFIGAGDLKAHEFVLTMVDDCYSPEEQQKFVKGLKDFDKLAAEKLGQSFNKSDAKERTKFVAQLEAQKDKPEALRTFYSVSRKHVIQSFTSSKPFLLDIRNYKIIPGSQYKGCVPLNKI